MARKIEVQIVGDASSLSRAFDKAERSASSFGSSVGGKLTKGLGAVAKAAGAAGLALGVGFGVVLKRGFDELGEAQKVTAQTEAVLKSTGMAAKTSAKEVSALAEALAKKSGVDDEAIQSGENLLLTFTNIRNEAGKGNDIFAQATKATLDLSVAMGKDLPSSALLVGKALNDPIKGMTALSRAGVQLSADQVKLIKGFVETGDVMGAQKVLLGELTTQFGGSAEAFGNTMPGALSKMKNAFDEAAGGLAQTFAPAVTGVANAFAGFLQKFNEAEGASAKFKVVMDGIKNAAEAGWKALTDAVRRIDWTAVANTVGSGVKTVAGKAWEALSAAVKAINWNEVGRIVSEGVVKAFSALAAAVKAINWAEVGSGVVRGIRSFLEGVNWPAVLGSVIRGLIAIIKGWYSLVFGVAKELGRALVDGAVAAAQALGPKIQGFLGRIPGYIASAIASVAQMAFALGTGIVQGIIGGMESLVGALVEKAKSIAMAPVNAAKSILGIGSPSKVFEGIGSDVVGGFILGITTRMPEVKGKMAETIQNALEDARAKVEGYQEKFGNAFGKLGDAARRAFDAKTQSLLDNIDAKFDAKIAKWQRFADALTPAEKALAQLDAAEAKRSRDSALRDAQEQLTKAKAIENEEERAAAILAAKEALRQAELAITRAGLEEQAATQRAAREQRAAEEIANLEETKNRLRTNLEEQRRILVEKLDAQLEALRNRLAKHPEEWDKVQGKVVKLLKAYGADFKTAGENLGKAFANGIDDSAAAVERSAKNLAAVVARYLKTSSPTEKGPMSTLDHWWDGFASTLVSGLDTKLVQRAAAAAAAVPPIHATATLGAAGGGGMLAGLAAAAGAQTVNVYVSVPAGADRAWISTLTREIRAELLRTNARNG